MNLTWNISECEHDLATTTKPTNTRNYVKNYKNDIVDYFSFSFVDILSTLFLCWFSYHLKLNNLLHNYIYTNSVQLKTSQKGLKIGLSKSCIV